jgi:hypothetical protein
MTEYYWRLVYGQFGELSTAFIPPNAVDMIKRRWDNGQPIHLNTGSVPANQIREFAVSERPFGNQKLLEDAAQAFHEPLLKGEAIEARWVKQTTTSDRWNKYYSQLPSYKKLNDDGAMTTMAFRQAVHAINPQVTPYCTPDEIKRLEH